jgi:Tol biopolymer transport system component
MTARDELDRRLAAWMTETASGTPPAGRFQQAMDATARLRPRPRRLADFGSDWVGKAGPRRVEWAWPRERRELVAAVLVAVLVAAAIVGAALVGSLLLRPDNSLPKPASNGWITFSGFDDSPAAVSGPHHIYLVSENGGVRRIIETGSDGVDRVCPSFSSDGTRLAYGQASGAPSATGFTDAALVVADIDPSGIVSNAQTFPVAGVSDAPCPIWSPDGRRIAFVFGWEDSLGKPPAGMGSVWVVTLDSGQVKVLPGVTAGDLDWAPDGSRLAIASGNQPGHEALVRTGGPLLVYSAASGEVRPLPGATGVIALAWSPDGSRIAYQSIRTPGTPADGGIVAGSETQEIWTIGPDGTGRTLQTRPFDVNHGIGPVWSPAGDRIVYERICAAYPSAANPLALVGPCRERHDVVVLTPGTTLSQTNPVGSEVVLPFAQVNGANGPETLFPYEVSWSPDGQKLLYLAWSEVLAPGQDHSLTALAAVNVDGTSPPILLREAEDIGLGLEFPAMIHPNSWGRLPGT